MHLRQASPAVKRTALRLQRPWRKEINWGRGERRGPILSIDVSDACADRALCLSEQIIAGAASVGWTFQAPPAQEAPRARRYGTEQPSVPTCGYLLVDGEALAFRIDERSKRHEHELTEHEKSRRRQGKSIYPPRWDDVPTGELRLHMTRADLTYVSRTWKDGSRRKLEHQIRAVLLALLDEAISIKADREKQRLAEIERRRQEQLRWEQSKRRAANTTLIHELEAQAGAWLRARFLRRYLRALRRAIEKDGTTALVAKRQDQTIDFLAWAQHYVDQLDPLCSTPHDADFEADRPTYYSPTDRDVNEMLDRLLGNHWSDAFKVGQARLQVRPRRPRAPRDAGECAASSIAPNPLDRDFTAPTANVKWAADFTYLRTYEGWLFIAVVMDLFSRRVIGWSMKSRMTADLVTDALIMAIWRRRPNTGLLHHSDQGSQYTSEAFQRLLANHGIECSMSRSGDVRDNAAAKSFFSTLKSERTGWRVYRTRDEAKGDVFDYIGRFCNPGRRHSALGYMSPVEFEQITRKT